MTLLAICKQCGEKNNFAKIIDILKNQGFSLKSNVGDVIQAINNTKPKCGNCFIEMTLEPSNVKVND